MNANTKFHQSKLLKAAQNKKMRSGETEEKGGGQTRITTILISSSSCDAILKNQNEHNNYSLVAFYISSINTSCEQDLGL